MAGASEDGPLGDTVASTSSSKEWTFGSTHRPGLFNGTISGGGSTGSSAEVDPDAQEFSFGTTKPLVLPDFSQLRAAGLGGTGGHLGGYQAQPPLTPVLEGGPAAQSMPPPFVPGAPPPTPPMSPEGYTPQPGPLALANTPQVALPGTQAPWPAPGAGAFMGSSPGMQLALPGMGPAVAPQFPGMGQYGQPQLMQPQYGQSMYGQPQFLQPQDAQPQFGQQQYVQPQYAQSLPAAGAYDGQHGAYGPYFGGGAKRPQELQPAQALTLALGCDGRQVRCALAVCCILILIIAGAMLVAFLAKSQTPLSSS